MTTTSFPTMSHKTETTLMERLQAEVESPGVWVLTATVLWSAFLIILL